MPPEKPPDHRLSLLISSSIISFILGFFATKKGFIRSLTFGLFGICSSLLGILVTIHSLLWFSKLSYLHPNINTLISGPQIFLWTLLSWQIIRQSTHPKWLVQTTTFFSIMAILIAIWEITPFGLQDNTAQIFLFLPFHCLFLFLVYTNKNRDLARKT